MLIAPIALFSQIAAGSAKPASTPAPEPIVLTENSSNNIDYTIISFDPARTDFGITFPQDTVCEEGVLVFNGGFYDENRNPEGLLISQGQELAPLSTKEVMSGILSIKDGQVSIVRTSDYLPRPDEDFVLQCGPLIIEPGGRRGIRGNAMAAERTILAIDKAGRAYIIVIKTPISLFDAQELLLKRVPNIDAALNLDGGPSSFYYYNQDDQDFSFGSANYPAYFINVTPSR
ncbi:MAG: phosphodiester glycosidase family protein [Candidatus Margulisbacteria bacterium]|nr:phosphodiester glycosidase family protein [Candidatus Margulisiibacteriota bacterium]